MATAVVDQPVFMLNEIPVAPLRRRRSSVIEVIDVESDDEISMGPVSRSQRRTGIPPSDVISLLDSDDDDRSSVAPGGSNHAPPRRAAGLYSHRIQKREKN